MDRSCSLVEEQRKQNCKMRQYKHTSTCKFGNFREGFIFKKLLISRSFVKIKPLQNGENSLLFADTGLQKRVCIGKLFSLFLIQNIDVDTQKNRLNETVLLSTQNIYFN